MRRFAISAFGAVLCLAFSTLFTQEVLSAEKAQRLCLVNSPAELSELLGVAYTQIRNPDSNLSLLGRS